MPIYALGDQVPQIDSDAYVHPDAVIIGAESSVWPTAVIRGDDGEIRIGRRSSIQDGTIIHVTPLATTTIGDECTIGHNVHLEGCTIEDDVLVGSGSVVLHRAVVRSGALVGAQALVPNGMEVPARAMALGVPATLRLDAVEPGAFDRAVEVYVHNAHWYSAELRRLD